MISNKTQTYPVVEEARRVTPENIRYGMLVQVVNNSGYHSGVKVHFFNKKGVLVGNYYEFVPYERLRLRAGIPEYPRYFMGMNYLKKQTPITENVKTWLFIRVCNIVTKLIWFTQKYMD